MESKENDDRLAPNILRSVEIIATVSYWRKKHNALEGRNENLLTTPMTGPQHTELRWNYRQNELVKEEIHRIKR